MGDPHDSAEKAVQIAWRADHMCCAGQSMNRSKDVG